MDALTTVYLLTDFCKVASVISDHHVQFETRALLSMACLQWCMS